MARAFLEYSKTVLKKVSFSSELFQIELTKALERLLPYEVYELKHWILDQFKNEPQLESCLIKVKQLNSKN